MVLYSFITLGIIKQLMNMESFRLLGNVFGFLAPIAFVFAIGALSYYGKLKKEIEQIKKELEELKGSKNK